MSDYLQPVGRVWRIASIICCAFTSAICLLLSLLMWTDMIRRHSFDYEGKPLWVGAAIVGVVGVVAAFVVWRLARRRPAANGITAMPVWFIQVFGLLLLAGICIFIYYREATVVMFEGVMISLAMIFVGRHIAKKRKQKI